MPGLCLATQKNTAVAVESPIQMELRRFRLSCEPLGAVAQLSFNTAEPGRPTGLAACSLLWYFTVSIFFPLTSKCQTPGIHWRLNPSLPQQTRENTQANHHSEPQAVQKAVRAGEWAGNCTRSEEALQKGGLQILTSWRGWIWPDGKETWGPSWEQHTQSKWD